MTVAQYAKQHGCSESRARVVLENMVSAGHARKTITQVRRTNAVGNRGPGSRIKIATYTLEDV